MANLKIPVIIPIDKENTKPFLFQIENVSDYLTVNTNENDRDSLEPHSLGEYRGRIARQVTVKALPKRDNKFYKVILPYNFDKKKYSVNNKEIEFYENKNYLKRKLEEFNKNTAFNIEQDYQPKTLEKFYLLVPSVLIFIVVLYLAIVISAFFTFNFLVIFTLGNWIRKGYNSLKMFKFILLEKMKIKEIYKILDEENKTQFCLDNKLKWIMGQSGYWIEVQKYFE